MSFQSLSDAIRKKTGVSISAQAMHLWANGGGITEPNLKAVADYFGVSAMWLGFGVEPARESLEDVLRSMPPDDRQQALDFISYKLERNETLGTAERTAHYLSLIDRIKRDMQERTGNKRDANR